MKKIAFACIIFISCTPKSQKEITNLSNKNITIYQNDIIEAVKILKKYKKVIYEEIDSSKVNETISIAFPEIIRYNAFQDVIESSTNKLLYIEGGKKVGNFSIGLFQMKPSFIEDLEYFIAQTESLNRFSYILTSELSERKKRTERYSRLENINWQIRYLNVFWNVASVKYKKIQFESSHEKIRFYATAYNCGFLKSDSFIKSMVHKEIYPYGVHFKGPQVAFSDITIEFLTHYSQILNK